MGRGFQNLVSFGRTGPFVHDANMLNSLALTGTGRGSGNHPKRDTLRPGGGTGQLAWRRWGRGEEEKGLLPWEEAGSPREGQEGGW